MDTATPRRRIFDVFLALLNSSKEPSEREHFLKNIQFTMDLCLRKWYHLPEVVGQAHFPLLHIFQQVVELQEAAQIFSALTHTNASNLDQKSAELKSILVTWRERLPNEWDDINTWSDLVSWRQHVFTAVNDTYLPLLPATQTSQGAANAPSYAYRGHHETAWIINRFAHVARKHHLMEVCMSSLNKIYTLPNIEIQEAFLKLREQAKCSFSNPAELTTGLEVINNTNLQYFTSSQKAEFFTLKAMFLSQLNAHDEAVQTFSTAVTLDMSFPKAWAQWGEYHDTMFKRNPLDLKHAAHAVSCYLQAASLYKNGKVRRLLIRILWFLSMDDAACTVATAFDSYKGEILTWYWLSLIPQLLLSLSHRESRYARAILMKIARNQPQVGCELSSVLRRSNLHKFLQALFFQLRAAKEESNVVKKQYMSNRKDNTATPSADANGRDEDTEMAPPQGTPQMPENHQHPWDLVEEITSILKTAYPMLALTLETMGDQIVNRFKPTQDEDFYRVLVALCNDAVSVS